MKKMTVELTYPGATLAQVQAMLGDPAFREEVAARQHVKSSTVTFTRSGTADAPAATPVGGGSVMVQENHHGTDRLPGFVRKLVGDSTVIRYEERWSSPTDATLEVTIPGKPGRLTGPVKLTQDGDAVVERLALDVTVNIPLVGGKIADLLEGLVGKGLQKENQVGREWLAR